MFRPTTIRRELVEELRARPFGPHHPELQAILTWLRTRPRSGKYVLMRPSDGRRVKLAELFGEPPRLRIEEEPTFETLEAAEWEVLQRLWREHTGQPLEQG